MKAIVQTKYGPPEVLRVKEVEKPTPKEDEVLVKIYASTVTAVDADFRRGSPFIGRFFSGLTGPKNSIPGTEFAGEIEAVGPGVSLYKEGDQVFGTGISHGVYAQYICLPEVGSTMAIKPANMNYEDAAGSVDGALTALPFIRDKAKVRSGQKVLINGASGSVGSAAVQIAKYYGAEVTGVCSTANLELVKSIGAGNVIDYKKDDFTQSGETYDVIFDTVGKISFGKCKNSLKEGGIFLESALTAEIIPMMLWTSRFGEKKAAIEFTGLMPPEERSKNLVFIKELIEAGEIKAVIDKTYPMDQISEAHRYVDTGRKKGNVVITIPHNGIS